MINEMDVGIMPLPDTPWARGKCSFKMLQYMSAAIPVVASPVGMNADVFQYDMIGYPASSCDDWLDALTAIYENEGLAVTMGSNGRKVILDHFSLGTISEKIANIFRSLA
ncbi:MAG: glycosyltransferase [Candidatus Hadarchaeum sp.]